MLKKEVFQETWGHLAPKKNTTYKGRVVFALGCMGSDCLNPTILSFDFGKLESSPWLFDHLVVALQNLKGEAGCVYEVYCTLRNYRFWMNSKKILDAEERL